MIRDLADPSLSVVVPDCRYGRMLVLANDRYMGAAFTSFGEYSESEVALWRQLIPPTAIVCDIGANIGAHTVALASLVPQGIVLAFEPLPFLFNALAGNLFLNGITNARAFNMALGEENGTLVVPAIDYTQRDNYGGLALLDHKEGNPMPLRTLDSVIAKADFLKIDVEGMERHVLAGAARIIRDHRPGLYVENNPGDGQQALIDYIHTLGYDLWWHRAPLFNPDNHRGAPSPDEHTENVCSHNMLCLPSEGDHDIQGLERIPPPSDTPPPPSLFLVEP